MAEVIDELIVVLGLDTRKFTEGQREALAAFKKTQEGAQSFGKGIEESGVKMAEMFGVLKKGILGVVGGIVGNAGVQFVKQVGDMDAATGRWAKTINTSIPNLSTWEGMISQIHGSAGAAASALNAMQQELNMLRFGGKAASPEFNALMNNAGINPMTDDADPAYRKAQAWIENQIKSGSMDASKAATWLNFMPGMNQDMINLMTDNFKKLEEAAKAVGRASKESADAGASLQKTGSLIGQYWDSVSRRVTTATSSIWDGINKIMEQGHYAPRGSMMDRMTQWLTGKDEMGDAKKHLAEGLSAGSGRASAADREAWIRQMAASMNIDPDIAVRVAKSEGFNAYSGDNGTSMGDFQLHVTPGGKGKAVGDQFRAATGLDQNDPKNERAMDEFALKNAAANGWGDYHGAARVGIGQWQGIGARGAASARGMGPQSSVSVQQNNTFNIKSTDPQMAATEVGGHLKRQGMVLGGDTGLA